MDWLTQAHVHSLIGDYGRLRAIWFVLTHRTR